MTAGFLDQVACRAVLGRDYSWARPLISPNFLEVLVKIGQRIFQTPRAAKHISLISESSHSNVLVSRGENGIESPDVN